MKVLVTGASGFVGSALVPFLRGCGFEVVAATRKGANDGEVAIPDVGPSTDWKAALVDCQAVVHAAARVHRMEEAALDGLVQARLVNTAGTLQLARQAAVAGVRRFVFISSVKVNGEFGFFSTDSPCCPKDAYGISKREAEVGLAEIATLTGMQLIVLRLPLVYGPGVGGNFLSLMHLVKRGLPLPLGAVANRRSMLYLRNLVDAIRACLQVSIEGNRWWYVSDGEDISTAELIRRLSAAMGVQPCLPSVSTSLVRFGSAALGKAAMASRILDSLTVDSGPLCDQLNWRAPYSMSEGLQATVAWFLEQSANKFKGISISKRLFDVFLALVCVCVLLLPTILVALAVRLTSPGPVLYWSNRIGRDNRIFKMPKFRSMRIDTPAVATHLLENPEQWLTPIGSFLRKSSLDELPQLWSILKGDMSFVGPRPALFNQDDLIALRTEKGVHELVPGLTGWAQVNGRDELPIPQKVQLDAEYLQRRSFFFDLKILWMTLIKVVSRSGVSH